MNGDEKIRLFVMSHQMVEGDLDSIEELFRIDLGRDPTTQEDKDERYYPQFDQAIRQEASSMALHYELFYCLEKSIRALIKETLEEKHGGNWWNTPDVIPDTIKTDVKTNMQRDIDSAVALRSTDEIDYTTFGQLGDIVRQNWDLFDDIFNSKKAFNKVMGSLNILRGPIAHCSPLPPSEVARLKTTVEDWFRLME